jgi:hypothetical protein
VTLIQVDCVKLHSPERIIQLLLNLRSRKSMIGVVADRKKQLGRDKVAVTRILPESFADKILGLSGAVLVGSIEEVDSVVKSCLDAANGLLPFDAAGNGEPSAEAHFRDFERTVAQSTLKHFCSGHFFLLDSKR